MKDFTNEQGADWADDIEMSDDEVTAAIQSLTENERRDMGLTRNAYWSGLYRQAENAAKHDYLTRHAIMSLESCRDLALADGDQVKASEYNRDIAMLGLVDEIAEFREALDAIDALFVTAAQDDA